MDVQKLTAGADASKSSTVRYGMYFFAGLLVAISPFTGYSAVKSFLDAQASAGWPTAEATILDIRIEENSSPLDDRRKKVSYSPRVEYMYRVGEQDYRGTMFSHSDMGSSVRAKAEALVARYPLKSRHPAAYDPQDPSHAVLEPGVSGGDYFKLCVPPGMLLLGVAIFLGARLAGRSGKVVAQ